MKKFLIIAILLTALTSCSDSEPILDSHEYTITDTTYIARNGFNMVLCYDVILLNHYDSTYHAGSVSPAGKLTEYNPRPINAFK